LDEKCTWKVKQLILQIKLGISHLTFKGKVIRTKRLEYFYGKVGDDKCDLCGREEEDVFHIMFICPHYNALRKRYLPKECNIETYSRDNYLRYYQNLNREQILKIFHFFNNVCHQRNVYLSYINDTS
jgi:hypothetical protein